MVKSFAQPVLHAEFLADGRTLRLSDKLARNISRQAAKMAALEAALNNNNARPVEISVDSNSSQVSGLKLSLRPAQLRALKFDDAMFHSILNSIAQQQILVENSSAKPVHVLRHEVLRNLLHAKMETGWYNGSVSQRSMQSLDTLADINVSSVSSSAAASPMLKVRSVNGGSLDLSSLLGEIISRFISPAQVSLDVTDQFCWEQDTSSARSSVHCTALELFVSGKKAVNKELGSKHVSAYGTAPMIFLQGMENGPPLRGILVEMLREDVLASLKKHLVLRGW